MKVYLAILLCGVLAMALGALWYGPLLGKLWMKITNADKKTLAERKKMQKSVWVLYLVQFVLVIFQVLILALFVRFLAPMNAFLIALLVWAAFIMPMIAGSSMWNNDSARISWSRFLIQSGYQLLCFIIFGLILKFLI